MRHGILNDLGPEQRRKRVCVRKVKRHAATFPAKKDGEHSRKIASYEVTITPEPTKIIP
jgi:hypothetical protein